MIPALPNTAREKSTKKGANETTKAAEDVYAKINKEVAPLMTGGEQIVFGPVEDFEYKVPLEDFQKSAQRKTA